MAYVVPQALVYQEFSLTAQANLPNLNAHIAGGHAYLARYADSDEKATALLGYYDDTQDVAYSWPQRPVGAVVDTSYTKLYIDNALLMYFEDTMSAGDTIQTVANYSNRVASLATNFKANGVTYPRDADFYDRDVALGDTVRVRTSVGGTEYVLWTYVKDVIAETVDDIIAAATSDAGNDATQSAPTPTETQTAGAVNNVKIIDVDQTGYDGLEDGDINETYTVLVTESSVGGDATTATLRVTSASGNDDVASVTPSAFDSPTDIGTRGLTLTFSATDEASLSLSADAGGYSHEDFVAGQTWVVTCGQAFTAPTPTSAGDYTGDVDCTYIIEVTKGGLWADTPQITVVNDKGTDMSGPTDVTAAAVAVVCGSLGVTVSFDESGLSKGDRYYVDVTAESDGAYRILELGHNLHQDVIDNGVTEVGLRLYIRKNIEVTENRTGFAPQVNWEQSATQFTSKSGIVAQDSTWTDGGVPMYLDVTSESTEGWGQMYVEYRAWRTELCNEVNSISDVGEIDTAITGPLHPDNELKWGVYKALSNSNGVEVRYTAVCDPSDVDEWADVIDLLDGRDDVHGLVPLTKTKTVQDLYQTHCESSSGAEQGRWRVCWLNADEITSSTIVDEDDTTDGEVALATISDNPLAAGTQYTLLEVPAGNAQFVTNDVQAGDIVRALYTTDGFGTVTYTEFVVDAVLNEDSLRLSTGHTVPVNTPQKIEVHRSLTLTEQSTALALTDGYADRRVRWIWPASTGSGDYTFEGYHLCAALAGLASGVVSHQGLTKLEINGFDDVTQSTQFSRAQLNTMAGGGVWIVTQDPESGDIYTRHAVTTDDYEEINDREEQVVRNVDAISYFFRDLYEPYIGISNVTDSMLTFLDALTRQGILQLKSNNYVARLGSQLIDGTITELRPHYTLQDRVVIVLDLSIPYALNNIECHLVV
jgi:hypothetical protein